ncbi:nucleotidyltransferase domain-containing protein [Paenibacillus nasutitermitis]|uniref:Uncharacterized protein n=1 Tax=Paenibacillus nasutitermitis TaxID=1652958 RepID=A0A916YUX3_9BACL|nr:hypothetical protein [Paenibacillus nasutitermitis]GGD62350.1 hypothetical protein GCM10010911_20310 [Paenibacillus nasutitermitis]
MIKPNFIEILKLLEGKLSKAKINWALTGSTSFALQRLQYEPNDIDIQTDQKGAYEIQSLFKEHVKREVSFSTKNNIRSYFGELNIDGVSVEIIGDIQKFDGTEWERTPNLHEIKHYINAFNLELPVLTLEYEVEAYRRIGRVEKAEALARFISKSLT